MSTTGNEIDSAQEDIREIDALLDRFQAAVVEGQTEALEEIFSPDAVCIFTGSSGVVRGVSEIAETWSRHMTGWTGVTVVRSRTLVRIHSDTAWATFTWDGSGTADGVRYKVVGERWSVVLVWESGGWRFAQTHSSLPFSDWQSLRQDG
jgi:uncharacterized protein (TIGR02246 family)